MSNSIRKSRLRPRVTSASFRSLAWLIHREACWAIIAGTSRIHTSSAWRTSFALTTRATIHRRALATLTGDPSRRFFA